jgi:hypothetical protein
MIVNDTTKWTPPADFLRVHHLRQRFALSEPTARLLASLAYGEARQ